MSVYVSLFLVSLWLPPLPSASAPLPCPPLPYPQWAAVVTLEEALLQALLGFGFWDGSGSGCGAGGRREEQKQQQQDQWAPHAGQAGRLGGGEGWVVRGPALCLPASTGLAPHSQVCHLSPARRPERFSPVEPMRLSAQAEHRC